MEDILEFLLVIGFLAVGFFKQAKKKTTSEPKEEGEVTPMPQETYDDPILEVSPAPPMAQKEMKRPKRSNKKSPKLEPSQTTPPLVTDSPQTEADYHLHSVEEVRRAFIWSEILHRKYE